MKQVPVSTQKHISDRQHAIVEAGSLIDALTDECPDVQEIKDRWHQLGLCVRAAIAEIREGEASENV